MFMTHSSAYFILYLYVLFEVVNEEDDADSEDEWSDVQTDSEDDDDVIDDPEENQVGA